MNDGPDDYDVNESQTIAQVADDTADQEERHRARLSDLSDDEVEELRRQVDLDLL